MNLTKCVQPSAMDDYGCKFLFNPTQSELLKGPTKIIIALEFLSTWTQPI